MSSAQRNGYQPQTTNPHTPYPRWSTYSLGQGQANVDGLSRSYNPDAVPDHDLAYSVVQEPHVNVPRAYNSATYVDDDWARSTEQHVVDTVPRTYEPVTYTYPAPAYPRVQQDITSEPQAFEPETYSDHDSSMNGFDSEHQARVDSIMGPLQFRPEAIEAYLALPDLIDGETDSVPASFIRTQSRKLTKTFSNTEAATHYLLFMSAKDVTGAEVEDEHQGDNTTGQTALYPVHEWTVASQCLIWHTLSYSEFLLDLPVVKIAVPHLDSIDLLFVFLHDHNEATLHRELEEQWEDGSSEGELWVRGFVANVVKLGVLSDALRGVVWAVVDGTADLS